ncbi:uncharacterized protein LOC122006006 [Zingiber officinale]|uniref:Uncharacterized protein n=1 Tax=Zingiber officinale TaxID=94328 RepID=A0A8J5KH18_ZINOF|nr:uncharacterized protein LOC122006006 [Zingiber officinale]KAG6489855.1 hypothetical protein ZIOFF_051136 [Zingiber officinale]
MLKASKEEAEVWSERAHGAAIHGVSAVPTAVVADFLSRSDEAARKRLIRMSEKLKQLEAQMEALEAEVSRAAAKDFSQPD